MVRTVTMSDCYNYFPGEETGGCSVLISMLVERAREYILLSMGVSERNMDMRRGRLVDSTCVAKGPIDFVMQEWTFNSSGDIPE